MNKRRIAQIILTGWLLFFVGLAVGSIGEQPRCEPFDSGLPFTVLIFFGTSAFLGFVSATRDKE